MMTDAKQVERVAIALCKSGKFETGEGTCALICLGQLGDARQGPCIHAVNVLGDLARAAIKAMKAA